MKLTQLSMAMALVATSSVSVITQAADWKGYPGTNCLPQSGSKNILRFSNGRIENRENSSQFIYCPLVRDISTGGPNRVKLARVRLTDNNQNENGSCTFKVLTITGALHASETKDWTATGDKTLTFGPLNTTNFGNFTLFCNIPGVDGGKKSYIRSYSLEEQ